MASERGHLKCATALLKYGANVDCRRKVRLFYVGIILYNSVHNVVKLLYHLLKYTSISYQVALAISDVIIYCSIIICDLPWGNQAKRNLVKASITNYILWTIAPANLKSLALVVMVIWVKYTWIAHTQVLQKIAMDIAMYIARESLYTRCLW